MCLSILSRSVRLCLPLRQWYNSSPIELRYEHFCRQLSPLVSLPFFPSRSLSLPFLFQIFSPFLFPRLSFFFLFFSFSLFTYFSTFCVETVTLLEPKRWSFYSSQCSSRFNFYSTVVLSLIKIPTKKSKTRYRKKNNTYRHSLYFLLNNRLDLIGILYRYHPLIRFSRRKEKRTEITRSHRLSPTKSGAKGKRGTNGAHFL